jgi:hypothetical protein
MTGWVLAQTASNKPHIGYLYPAGGQTGTVVQITAGGQFLRGASEVHITGSHVSGRVIQHFPPVRNLQKEQRDELLGRIREARDKQLANPTLQATPPPPPARATNLASAKAERPEQPGSPDAAETVNVPNHPLWYNLESKNLRELAHISSILSIPRLKQQPNRQIAESVLIEITIDPEAVPGDRELRIVTAGGLTNPMVFQVGVLPEIRELEPNNGGTSGKPARLPGFGDVPETEPLELPLLMNGQVMPGDADRFRFRAAKDQLIVISVEARSLIPYLADAVPGWFQAVLTLYDEKGFEIAFADDYRFQPDPVLCYTIPAAGVYELEIRDSIYRGREDFVYRIAAGELLFITQMYPLGTKEGVGTCAGIEGWNLPASTLSLDAQTAGTLRRAAYHDKKQRSNEVMYSVDALPECEEIEPNNDIESAQPIIPPKIINGRISSPGDQDLYRVNGRAGEILAVEVFARRLNSPLDSLVRVSDAAGTVIQWNDDYTVCDNFLYNDITGIQTHPADSYLMATLPKDGIYTISLTDSQGRGGHAFGYRLRVSPPQPDYCLRMTPSSLTLSTGTETEFDVYVLRNDGFQGEVDIVLKNAPPGLSLHGGPIAAGSDHARLTLKASRNTPPQTFTLQMEGRAKTGDHVVNRPVVPAEEMMQAFLYRHLVPSQELVVSVRRPRRLQSTESQQVSTSK